MKSVFWFSLQVVSETFLILRRIQRDNGINVRRSSCKNACFCRIFMDPAFLDAFSKNPHIKFHKDGDPVVPCGQTDKQTHDVSNSRFSQFRIRAPKVKDVFLTYTSRKCSCEWVNRNNCQRILKAWILVYPPVIWLMLVPIVFLVWWKNGLIKKMYGIWAMWLVPNCCSI